MNWVDIAIIFVIAVTSLYSFMWGFVRQLLLIVCFAAGLYVALTYHGWLYEQFTQNWIDNELIARVVAGAILWTGTFAAASILTIPLFRLLRSKTVKFLDHLTGLFFGFFLGWAITGVAWIAVVLTFEVSSGNDNVKNARLLPYVHMASLAMLNTAERAPFLQDDINQLRILDAWDAMQNADPRKARQSTTDLQADGGLRSEGGGDAIGTLISNTGN